MSERNYYIYKMFRDEEEENVYFRPNSTDRMKRLLAYRMSGYSVLAYIRVTEEDWYNSKLRDYCNEYCAEDREEHYLHSQYVRGEYPYSEECLLDTLTLIQDRKWCLLKSIHRTIRAMARRDLEIREEIAILLNDQYLKAIL